MAEQCKRIRSAVIDGRAQTPRYIQKQLTHLHDALRKHQQAIHDAIRRDSDYTSAEADIEIYLALKALKDEYEAIVLAKVLEQEYSIAHGKENLSRRVAAGCVYIIPCQHSLFYSIIQPVAVAIAAGNCVMVEISQTTLELTTILRKIFAETMDKDTFAVLEAKPSDQDFLSQHCVVVDGRLEPSSHTAYSVVKAPSSCTVAVVDRTSNINEAARELVRARFSFRGVSPYSPDLVLVNEFTLKDFCSAATLCATEHVGSSLANGSAKPSRSKTASEMQTEVQESNAITLISGSRGSIIVAQERESSLLGRKISEPILLIHPIKSLDDAIDLANSKDTPLLAAYLFAKPAAAKYLSQFINASASFTNTVPIDLLVGPAAPTGFTTSLATRYTKEMLSLPRPEFITVSPQTVLLSQLLDQNDKDSRKKVFSELSKPLSPMNEPAGKAIGFFEQGLFTGGGIVVASAVTGLALVVRYTAPVIMRKIR